MQTIAVLIYSTNSFNVSLRKPSGQPHCGWRKRNYFIRDKNLNAVKTIYFQDPLASFIVKKI